MSVGASRLSFYASNGSRGRFRIERGATGSVERNDIFESMDKNCS